MVKKNLYLTFIFSQNKKIHGQRYPFHHSSFHRRRSYRGERRNLENGGEGEGGGGVCVQRWRTVGRSRAASKETMAIHLMKISGRMPITPMITDPGIIGMRLRFRIRIRVSRRRSRAESIRGHESIYNTDARTGPSAHCNREDTHRMGLNSGPCTLC